MLNSVDPSSFSESLYVCVHTHVCSESQTWKRLRGPCLRHMAESWHAVGAYLVPLPRRGLAFLWGSSVPPAARLSPARVPGPRWRQPQGALHSCHAHTHGVRVTTSKGVELHLPDAQRGAGLSGPRGEPRLPIDPCSFPAWSLQPTASPRLWAPPTVRGPPCAPGARPGLTANVAPIPDGSGS